MHKPLWSCFIRTTAVLLQLFAFENVRGQLDLGSPITMDCSNGRMFNRCGSACPPSCDSLRQLVQPVCTRQCVAGCFCPSGMVELGSGCVTRQNCPSIPIPQLPEFPTFSPPVIITAGEEITSESATLANTDTSMQATTHESSTNSAHQTTAYPAENEEETPWPGSSGANNIPTTPKVQDVAVPRTLDIGIIAGSVIGGLALLLLALILLVMLSIVIYRRTKRTESNKGDIDVNMEKAPYHDQKKGGEEINQSAKQQSSFYVKSNNAYGANTTGQADYQYYEEIDDHIYTEMQSSMSPAYDDVVPGESDGIYSVISDSDLPENNSGQYVSVS